MKKLIALSIVLGVLVGVAFAQDAPAGVTVTGKFDAWLMPLQVITREVPDGADTKNQTLVGAGLGRDNNGGKGPRGRLFLEGKTDKLGLKLQLQFFPANAGKDATGVDVMGFDDFAEVWVKPADWVKIDVGKFVDDTLRGKVGDGSWMDGVTVGMRDGDSIFSRFKSQGMNSDGQVGALVGFTFGGLYIGALVPGLKPFGADPFNKANYETAAADGFDADEDDFPDTAGRVYSRIQAGVGYTIKDIGLVRAQFVGANAKGTEKDGVYTIVAPKIEVAFALTAISGLTLDVGAKIPLPFSDDRFWNTEDYKWDKKDTDTKYQAPIQISLGAVYGINAISIAARVDTKFAGKVEYDGADDPYKLPFELNAHLWPSFKLSFATIGVDFGIEYIGETTWDGTVQNGLDGGVRVGFGAWIEKGMGAATIKGGLAYKAGTEVNSAKEDGVFSIPIVFEYSF